MFFNCKNGSDIYINDNVLILFPLVEEYSDIKLNFENTILHIGYVNSFLTFDIENTISELTVVNSSTNINFNINGIDYLFKTIEVNNTMCYFLSRVFN